MADYYPVLTRAVAALDPNTAETRRAVYERARQAIVKQLRSYDPPLSESEITKERLGLEEAVRKIEAEHRTASQPQRTPLPPLPDRMPPPPSSRAEGPAAPSSPAPSRPAVPESRIAGSEGLTKVHAAAAAAASLGAATANARVAASTTQAAFEPPAPRPAPRIEPNFERPRVPGPVPEGRPIKIVRRDPDFEDPNPHLREPEPDLEEPRPKAPAIGGLVAIVLVLALGVGAYLARDQIAGLLGTDTAETVTAPTDGPKVADRVGAAPDAVPDATLRNDTPPADQAAAQQQAAPPAELSTPTTPGDGSLVAQRAILYDEAPDAQEGAATATGSVAWRTEPMPNDPQRIQLVGEVNVPERGLGATITFTRNLDKTLSASHMIEIVFTTPPDFANGGVGNVPGILFKPSESEGGSALKGMSVKVMKNMFWIGLEQSPADREQNMQAIRTRGWIDLPILYENGRRAVLTIEKGTPGERAFETAFAAWDAETAQAPQ
jgi:hypothetical protein